jgi:hypothetical protein
MQKYKIGDRVEELHAGEVVDTGTVMRIEDYEVWCMWNSDPNTECYFLMPSPHFRLAKSIPDSITYDVVREVLKTYQDYSKMEYMPEYVHQEVYNMISQKGVKESEEFKEFMVQYEKFKNYL